MVKKLRRTSPGVIFKRDRVVIARAFHSEIIGRIHADQHGVQFCLRHTCHGITT